MRILVLSNFYPPHYIGGYELGCRDVVEALRSRGHEVSVLTSFYGRDKPESDGGVYRWLETDIGWEERNTHALPGYIFRLLRKEIKNQSALKRLCRQFRPDIVYIWKLTHTSVSLAFAARDFGYPVCFYIFDHWLTHWESDDRWYRFWYYDRHRKIFQNIKKILILQLEITGLLRGSGFPFSNIQFASAFLKDTALKAGKPVKAAEVIYWGIDPDRFPFNNRTNVPPRLLYVGQIIPVKGVHTAVEAIRILVKKYRYPSLKLTLAGGSMDKGYLETLRNSVRSAGLEENILFRGFIPHEDILAEYQNHDILLFPSIWDEPFGIVILEAMSCGLGVVATGTGGSREILGTDGRAALLFTREDAGACAARVKELVDDPGLLQRVRSAGRHRIEEEFRFERTMDLIERSLQQSVRK